MVIAPYRAAALLLLYIGGWVQADQLCLGGHFDTQVRYLLQQEMLTPQQVRNMTRVYDDVRRTLQQRWPDVQIRPFGSLVIGLATKMSDVDLVVQVHRNESSEKFVVKHAMTLLKRQPELYSQLTTKYGRNTVPLINLYHIPTQKYCDISFKSHTSVENSHLLAYYFKLDQRNLPLASLIKFWSIVHHGRGASGIIKGYVIYLLVVFYLQQKNIVPPIILLQENMVNHFDGEWDTSFTKSPYNTSNTEGLYELLGGFFKYYSQLNFSDTVLSPFVGRLIPKSAFGNISSIPEDLYVYKSYLKRSGSKPLNLNTDLCIQDLFQQNKNVGIYVLPEHFGEFVSHVKLAAKAFEELPSDSFLAAIMTRDVTMGCHRDQHVLDTGRYLIDEVRKLEDCTPAYN